MKEYKPVSDREIARRLSITSIHSAHYYLPIIQEIFNLGLVICERVNRPQGEWIEDPINKNNMYCSNCKVSYTKDFLRGMSLYREPKDTPNFCPNCGTKMKGTDYVE